MATDHGASVAASSDPAIPSNSASKPKLAFYDLPSETQLEIISHCSQADLICVALVSKRFHELASTHLYRNFHILFPNEDDIYFDAPIDGLASGLDTLTTSDYNYAKHLKDIFMDTLSAGPKGESAYQPYLYSASCGKFLNTLLYLTLKRVKSLEGFRWNIRVELSRPVYRELHRIPSLRTLHIRMQAGESYYNPPPPLPASTDSHQATGPLIHPPDIPSLSTGSTLMIAGPSVSIPSIVAGPPPPLPSLGPPSKSLPKSKADKRGPLAKDPSTLSGFKKLRSLSVLDIDDLDIVTELNTCIKNSSLTLTELQLSFSDSLAEQARKPPSEVDPDDSDVDDEFQVIPVHQNTDDNASGPAKAFRAQEQRKVQEAVLGRIFDIDPPTELPVNVEGGGLTEESNDKNEPTSAEDARQSFYHSLQAVSAKLMTMVNGSQDLTASQQDVLDIIEKAAKKFVATIESDSEDDEVPSKAKRSGQSSTEKDDQTNKEIAVAEKPTSSSTASAAADKEVVDKTDLNENENESEKPLKAATRRRKIFRDMKDASPDDIDIAHLESSEDVFADLDDQSGEIQERAAENLETDQTNDAGSATSTSKPLTATSTSTGGQAGPASTRERKPSHLEAHSVALDGLMEKLGQFQEISEALKKEMDDMRAQGKEVESAQIHKAEAQVRAFHNYMEDVQGQIKMIEREIADTERWAAEKSPEAIAAEQSMRQYIRETRGLSLTALSIHLIPVKASILSRAVNLSCLKKITLLNVGNQAPIWRMLAKENRVRPLAVRSIFTDNVSNSFLTFASQLEEIRELFLLERDTKHKPESFAPRTETTIDQIRRLVLKKHMGTLKRLMIKDESNGPNWDTNEKTMILICTRGRQLEELAVSMNIHAVHAFMQYFSGLVKLRAINILRFKNNDTCIWVIREIPRFIVDNLSLHPELKLEYIAMEDDRVDRVVRPAEVEILAAMSDAQKSGKTEGLGKGKGKAASVGLSPSLHEALPAFPAEALDSESDSEEETVDSGTRLRFQTLGPLPFYDIWGIKIFEKEIRKGRL